MAESAGKEDPVELDSSLTFVKRHKRCRIGGSFGAGEIPLLLLFFYLLNEAGLDFCPTSGVKVLRGPTRVEDIDRWGVWLGRHIC